MDTVQFKVNLPKDIREWLAERAKREMRSTSAQLVILLRGMMDKASDEPDRQE